MNQKKGKSVSMETKYPIIEMEVQSDNGGKAKPLLSRHVWLPETLAKKRIQTTCMLESIIGRMKHLDISWMKTA